MKRQLTQCYLRLLENIEKSRIFETPLREYLTCDVSCSIVVFFPAEVSQGRRQDDGKTPCCRAQFILFGHRCVLASLFSFVCVSLSISFSFESHSLWSLVAQQSSSNTDDHHPLSIPPRLDQTTAALLLLSLIVLVACSWASLKSVSS
jgi:hypothetical protein